MRSDWARPCSAPGTPTSLASMDFVLNGQQRSLDAATVRSRVTDVPPELIRTHWVKIDGRCWPPKQAFRIATGLTDEPFISHFALRIFQGLGFETSAIPDEVATKTQGVVNVASPTGTGNEDAVAAFGRLDEFLTTGSLTSA